MFSVSSFLEVIFTSAKILDLHDIVDLHDIII